MTTLLKTEQKMTNNKTMSVSIDEFKKRSNSMFDLIVFNAVSAGINSINEIAKKLRMKPSVIIANISDSVFATDGDFIYTI